MLVEWSFLVIINKLAVIGGYADMCMVEFNRDQNLFLMNI